MGLRAEIFPAWASRCVCIVAFDNCLINFATSYEGIRALGDGSRPYLFINWFLRPINVAEIPESLKTLAPEGLFYCPQQLILIFLNTFLNSMRKSGIWSTTITVAAVAEWMADSNVLTQHFRRIQSDHLAIAKSTGALSILAYPDTPSVKTSLIYQPHVPTANGTAGYADVRLFLERLKAVMTLLGIPVQIVFGDQQSFSRMVWLKRKEPASYKQIVPCPGDFHTAVHMLMAIHILWWNCFISNIIQETELSELSIAEDWSSVELYNRYRQFYETVIVGVLAYIVEVVPEHLLDQLDLLLEVTADVNKGY